MCCCEKDLVANIQKLNENAIVPVQSSACAAGFDLSACIENDIEIAPGGTEKIGTGLAITPPAGYFGAIFARSGIATKRGLRPANCVGVCDEDYTGEYIVALHNDSEEWQIIHSGDRIAQLVFLPYMNVSFNEVEQLDVTDRGAGGFGSTGQ